MDEKSHALGRIVGILLVLLVGLMVLDGILGVIASITQKIAGA